MASSHDIPNSSKSTTAHQKTRREVARLSVIFASGKLLTRGTGFVGRVVDTTAKKMAWMLPRRVAYWCAIRVAVHASTGKWSDQEVPALGAMQALGRWDDR